MLEKDLYQPIKEFFTEQGFIVRGEVEKCDLVAVRQEEIVVVELKKNLTIKLLTQAVKRQRISDKVYLAVPKPKKFRYSRSFNDTIHLLRRLELGLLFVNFTGKTTMVQEIVEPKVFDIKRSKSRGKKKRIKLVKEVNDRHADYNVGGSVKEKLMTAYREKVIHIACCLSLEGQLSTKELRALGTDQAKTTTILYNNHYGWFNKIGRGLYELNEKGIEEMAQYEQIKTYYMDLIHREKSIKSCKKD